MRFFRLKRSRYTLDELAVRREKRAEVVRTSLPLFAMVLLLCMVVLLSLLCLQPFRQLRELERERDSYQVKLDKAKENLKREESSYMWMLKDSEYFEMIARDKNNLALPGEQVVRIAKPDVTKPQPLR